MDRLSLFLPWGILWWRIYFPLPEEVTTPNGPEWPYYQAGFYGCRNGVLMEPQGSWFTPVRTRHSALWPLQSDFKAEYGVPQETQLSGHFFCSILENYVLPYLKIDHKTGSVAYWFSFLCACMCRHTRVCVHWRPEDNWMLFPQVLSITIVLKAGSPIDLKLTK